MLTAASKKNDPKDFKKITDKEMADIAIKTEYNKSCEKVWLAMAKEHESDTSRIEAKAKLKNIEIKGEASKDKEQAESLVKINQSEETIGITKPTVDKITIDLKNKIFEGIGNKKIIIWGMIIFGILIIFSGLMVFLGTYLATK